MKIGEGFHYFDLLLSLNLASCAIYNWDIIPTQLQIGYRGEAEVLQAADGMQAQLAGN
jgi:hypothetical protein